MSSEDSSSVAFLDLHAQSGGFIENAGESTGARLRGRGYETRILHSVRAEHPGDQDSWLASIVQWVREGDEAFVVLARAWNRELVDTIRAAMGEEQRLVRIAGQGGAAAVDALFDHVVNFQGLEALMRGEKAGSSAWRKRTARELRVAVASRPEPAMPSAGEGTGRPMITGPVAGCPFLLDSNKNPIFAPLGVDAERVQTRGCTFCLDNIGAYAAPPPQEMVDSWLAQLHAHRAANPKMREVLLTDERPHPYLPSLFRALLEPENASIAPIELMIKSRVDWLLEFGDGPVTEAAQLAAKTGSTLNIYLVGFENFDQFHLDLFNKGYSADFNELAIEKLRELATRFPNSFEYKKYQAHGIVLFTPWTTPEALIENARRMRAVRFEELRADALRTRLRLYPRVPLHALAEKDGLLADDFAEGHSDRAAEQGYDASVPWRFADPRTAAIYQLIATFQRQDRSLPEADLLEMAANYLLRWPGLAQTPQLAHLPLRQALKRWDLPLHEVVAHLGPLVAAYDTEIDGIAQGRRQAALKELVRTKEAQDLVRAYEAMGLAAAVVSRHEISGNADVHERGDEGQFSIVAVASDAGALEQVVQAQRSMERGGGAESVHKVGGFMGYPLCCSRAFTQQRTRADNVDNERGPFLRSPDAPLHPLLNRLGTVQLISHHLCGPDCSASAASAQAELDAIAAIDPETAQRLQRELRSPVLFIDYHQRFRLAGAWSSEADDSSFHVESVTRIGPDRQGVPEAVLTAVDRLEISADQIGWWVDGELRHRLAAHRPLLVVPGEALAPAARSALAEVPAAASSARIAALPSAIRPGVRVREFHIAAVRSSAQQHLVVLQRGADSFDVAIRAHDPGRPSTLRKGQWAIEVDAPDKLSTPARFALGLLVRALPT